MKKKYKIVGIVIVAVLIVSAIAYFSYQYYKKETPDYSFQQIQKAFTNHDTTALDQYFDVETIANNVWPRIEAKTLYSSQQSILAQAINTAAINKQKADFKNGFKQATYDAVLGKSISGQSTEIKHGALSLLSESNIHFAIKDNNIATADYVYQNYASDNTQNYPIYKFKIIMTKQNNHTWKLTDIQGYEDVFTTSIDDTTRATDLNTIGTIINQYITTTQKPFIDNDNWRTVLDTYLNQKGQYTAIPNDPLSSYGNKYFFAIINSDSIKSYSYVLQAKLSSVNNNSGAFQDQSYKNSISTISKGTNIILGIDCDAPALCNIGSGNNSEFYKLMQK